jgi:hypothetical protein
MFYYSESVIEAMKENRKRQIAEQIKRNNQFKEARQAQSNENKRIASFLKAAKRQLSQLNPPQHFGQSNLVKREYS